MQLLRASCWFVLGLIAASCSSGPDNEESNVRSEQGRSMKYPTTKTVSQVDRHHGVSVADPYRWLETDVRQSTEVRAWVDEQHDFYRYPWAIHQHGKLLLQGFDTSGLNDEGKVQLVIGFFGQFSID